MKTLSVGIVALFGILLAGGASANIQSVDKGRDDPDYPHRPKYPDVAIIDTAELSRKLSDVQIVDVRSEFEFATLRVKGAVNVPIGDAGFVGKVFELRERAKKPLVFYCNGKTCLRSYEAARRAIRSARVSDCYVYDAGIYEWARTNPDRTELLGRGPVKVESLISKAKLEERMLAPRDFAARVGPDTMVLDVRDLAQRDVALFPFVERRAALDQRDQLNALIDQARRDKKTLLVYDKVGHQVQALQYHLEDRGLKSYYFLKGGEEAYSREMYGASRLETAKPDAK